MDPREERLVRNEALFRLVNERLRRLGESFSLVAEHAEFVCECADTGCTARISMPLPQYKRIRREPTWFIMIPDHVVGDVEAVVERHDGYVVVEKPPGEVADAAKDLGER